jgi:signal transduction histidine kinase
MASLHNVEEDELGTQYDNEQLSDVSVDEPRADTPQDEDEKHRRIWWAKNAKRAQRRHNAQNHAHAPRDLNNAFAAIVDREYRTPISTIIEAALLTQQLPSNPQIQRLHYLTQHALVQLDGQHLVSSTQNPPLVCRTPRGGHGS